MRFLTKFDNGVNRLDGDLCSSTRVTRRPGDALTYIFEDLDLNLQFAKVLTDYRPLRKSQKQSCTRGRNHIDSATLLCTLDFYEFLDDPRFFYSNIYLFQTPIFRAFMDAVQDGTIKITHHFCVVSLRSWY